MLTVACVLWGDYQGRGIEYVTILQDMVRRNLGPHRFVCLTDRDDLPCETIQLPEGLYGWWNKLALFQPGLFEGRVLYLDLDVVVTGPLDDFPKGIIKDWNLPGYNSSVMCWDAGDYDHIWTRFDPATVSRLRGDQDWIAECSIWPTFPEGMCVSYKSHASYWPPENARVVCFHGHPKPHDALADWVPPIWCVGGVARPRFIQGLNVAPEVPLQQAEQNLARDLPLFRQIEEHSAHALIVGGGPSLKDMLPHLRKWRARGHPIFALNGTHDWLLDRGIVPHYHVLLDARQENVGFVGRPHPEVTYLVAAQCHPDVFTALEGYNVVMWLGWHPGAEELADKVHKPLTIVGGGNTVGLKTMCIAFLWGFRTLHLYGFDSSYAATHHAYPQPLNDSEATLEITAAGKTFKCARWMARQAMDFQHFAKLLAQRGCDIRVHGSGLIPWIVKQWTLTQTTPFEASSPVRKRTTLPAMPNSI